MASTSVRKRSKTFSWSKRPGKLDWELFYRGNVLASLASNDVVREEVTGTLEGRKVELKIQQRPRPSILIRDAELDMLLCRIWSPYNLTFGANVVFPNGQEYVLKRRGDNVFFEDENGRRIATTHIVVHDADAAVFKLIDRQRLDPSPWLIALVSLFSAITDPLPSGA